MGNTQGLLFTATALAAAALISSGLAGADEVCRWEKCDFPMMSAGKPLSAICACYRTECNEPAATMECACEEARHFEGRALDEAGKDVGRMAISISPDRLPAEPGQSATITVDVDLAVVNQTGDASFRVAVSSGEISQDSFWITGKTGTGPPITYATTVGAEPGDVLVRVFGGWSVILLGQSTGEVYEGKTCFRLE